MIGPSAHVSQVQIALYEPRTKTMALRALCVLLLILFWSEAQAETHCNRDFSEIYSETAQSVVRVHAVKIDPFRVVERVQRKVGAGVFIDDKRIVTNAHTIWGATAVAVLFNDQQRFAAIVGADPISDIAVLEIEIAVEGTTPIRWGDSDNLKVGQDVIAIGHPVALTASATRGIVSGTSRVLPISPMSWLTPLIQTDATTFPGSSGGPLIDRCGEAIGLNSLIIRGRSGINFAIPSNIIQNIAAEILKHKRVIRPWHGIHGRSVDGTLRPILEVAYGMPIPFGFLVETVEPGSPAQKAGLIGGTIPVNISLQEYLIGGDVITKVNGIKLDSMETVVSVAKGLKVGQKLNIEFLRGRENHIIEVELPERPVLQGDVRRFAD